MDQGWPAARRRTEQVLSAASTPDDVARGVLEVLAGVPGVSRVAIALSRQGGRTLRFTSTDTLTVDGGSLDWCEVDGLAELPVVDALLSGRAVWLRDLDAVRAAYPHLVERQEELGTGALGAVPIGTEHAGALLVAMSEPTDFGDCRQVLAEVAQQTAGALATVSRNGMAALRRPRSRSSGRRAVLRLPDGAAAPRRARRFLRDRLSAWDVAPSTGGDLELCLSEVVTNAVIHAGTDVELVLLLRDDRVRVQVMDHGRDGAPGAPPAPDQTAVGGRGLVLVEHLADCWHYERADDGTTVWFEVLLPPAVEAAAEAAQDVGVSTVSAPGMTSHRSGRAATRSPSA